MTLAELRFEARATLTAVVAGDDSASARVGASHPKYVGHCADRIDRWRFGLRDANSRSPSNAARHLGQCCPTVTDEHVLLAFARRGRPSLFWVQLRVHIRDVFELDDLS